MNVEPNKAVTTKHTKGTKNELLMVLWSLRALRVLHGEQISATAKLNILRNSLNS